MLSLPESCDVAIVGAGAAGLATAIFAGRRAPALRILLFDGATKPGAKILVSGGSRCNVTNATVRETDFWGGRRTVIRRVLRGLTVAATVAFFRDLGVPLHEEEDGKLFPDSNRSRDVLEALLRACGATGAQLAAGARVEAVARDRDGFRVAGSWHPSGRSVSHPFTVRARRVVLATGGASLPKTGSDGGGYIIAASLGHTIVPITPALAPLVLDPSDPFHRGLSGVSHEVGLVVSARQRAESGPQPQSGSHLYRVTARLRGSLLWTHFGVSGPVALNASRHWARADLESQSPAVTISLFPAARFEALESDWIAVASARPHASVRTLITSSVRGVVPDAVATAVLDSLGLDARLPIARLSRVDRRRLLHRVLDWPLPVIGTRGLSYAEATAGGVDLGEIDPSTMESRISAGLYLVGEILDVDGRIGGFNFQWAWSSAHVAAQTAFRLL